MKNEKKPTVKYTNTIIVPHTWLKNFSITHIPRAQGPEGYKEKNKTHKSKGNESPWEKVDRQQPEGKLLPNELKIFCEHLKYVDDVWKAKNEDQKTFSVLNWIYGRYDVSKIILASGIQL